RFLTAKRNRFLSKARDTLTEKPAGWPRCVELGRQIDRFETRIWPRWKDLDSPPGDPANLHRFLFYARRYGELPTDPGHLHNLLG
ncbi:MAG: hypothetical protein KZQ77_18145, partial [Candidatus Thiodiazotropha sp. (ex Notomyrtea botanica)]|nr:hypothetical protein [Candidatus Thiodiazotropha sp. (ex Notomyrtea botanica)]